MEISLDWSPVVPVDVNGDGVLDILVSSIYADEEQPLRKCIFVSCDRSARWNSCAKIWCSFMEKPSLTRQGQNWLIWAM